VPVEVDPVGELASTTCFETTTIAWTFNISNAATFAPRRDRIAPFRLLGSSPPHGAKVRRSLLAAPFIIAGRYASFFGTVRLRGKAHCTGRRDYIPMFTVSKLLILLLSQEVSFEGGGLSPSSLSVFKAEPRWSWSLSPCDIRLRSSQPRSENISKRSREAPFQLCQLGMVRRCRCARIFLKEEANLPYLGVQCEYLLYVFPKQFIECSIEGGRGGEITKDL
jgi:hypothetical protein